MQDAHIARPAGDAEHPGLLVDQLLDLGRTIAARAHQVDQHARIDVAGPRTHDDAARWRQAHARIDRPTFTHRSDAGAVAEMRNY